MPDGCAVGHPAARIPCLTRRAYHGGQCRGRHDHRAHPFPRRLAAAGQVAGQLRRGGLVVIRHRPVKSGGSLPRVCDQVRVGLRRSTRTHRSICREGGRDGRGCRRCGTRHAGGARGGRRSRGDAGPQGPDTRGSVEAIRAVSSARPTPYRGRRGVRRRMLDDAGVAGPAGGGCHGDPARNSPPVSPRATRRCSAIFAAAKVAEVGAPGSKVPSPSSNPAWSDGLDLVGVLGGASARSAAVRRRGPPPGPSPPPWPALFPVIRR